MYETADELAAKAAENREKSTEAIGRFPTDIVFTGTQMLVDTGANLVLPGSGLVSMGLRSYGSGSRDARQQGMTEEQQFLSGAKTAGIEILTEKLFGVFGKTYGGGVADDMAEAVIGKLASTDKGRTVLRIITNMAEEGSEEALSDVLNPLADRLLGLDDGQGSIFKDTSLEDVAYDYLVGSVMGGFGAGTNVLTGQDATNNAALRARDGKSQADSSQTVSTAPQTAQATNANVSTVYQVLSSGRVNNTVAETIAADPGLSQAFTAVTGIELSGTTNDKRTTIQQAARDLAYRNSQVNTAVQAHAEAETQLAAQEIADQQRLSEQQAAYAQQQAQEQAVKNSGYDSYIRGMALKGMTVADAREILRNPEMKSTWERLSGIKLPESNNRAVNIIRNTRLDIGSLPSVDVPTAAQTAQEAAENIQTPGIPQNASTAPTAELNQAQRKIPGQELLDYVNSQQGQQTAQSNNTQTTEGKDLLLNYGKDKKDKATSEQSTIPEEVKQYIAADKVVVKHKGKEYTAGDIGEYVEWLTRKYGADTINDLVDYLVNAEGWSKAKVAKLVDAAQTLGYIQVEKKNGTVISTPEYAAYLADEYYKPWLDEASQQQNNTAPQGAENTMLNDADLQEYLSVGERQHVRNAKDAQLRNGESPILTTIGQIRKFIRSAMYGEQRDTIKAYGKVGGKLAQDILNASDGKTDVSGYYLELDGNRLRHMKDHIDTDTDGRNIPLSAEQAELLTEYINEYDRVLRVLKRKDGSTRVYLSKKTSDGHVVIVELVSKGRQSLQPVTAWQNTNEAFEIIWGKERADSASQAGQKSGSNGYQSALTETTSPVSTGSASAGAPAPTISIPSTAQNVNTETDPNMSGQELLDYVNSQQTATAQSAGSEFLNYGKDGQNNTASVAETGRQPISMEDYANRNSPVWNNLDYDDTASQQKTMQAAHNRMTQEGKVVVVPEETIQKTSESFPDLRSMKKADRTPILKQKMSELKTSLRQFLSTLKGSNFEFEINGNVLEARLYDTGIKEVLEKVNQEKANMLSQSDQIFKNAEYLYSLPDYDGDPNVYRWNYFYTPVKIGDSTVGVRIAVRDMASPAESQIYNWGIKKSPTLGGGSPELNSLSSDASSAGGTNASLDGARRLPNNGSIPGGVSSEASEVLSSPTSIPNTPQNVNTETDPNMRERGNSRNIRTDQNMEAELKQNLENDPLMYQQLSNADTLAKTKEIWSQGFGHAYDTLREAIGKAKAGYKIAPEMAPLSKLVENELVRRGDVQAARQIASDIGAELTYYGQVNQANIILRNSDPITVQDTIQKTLDKLNEEPAVKRGKWKAELTQAEIDLINSTDFTVEGNYEAVVDQISQRLGEEMPATLWEKLTEIRRVNMLLRPRTMVKNLAGNVPTMVIRKAANELSGLIQDGLVKTGLMSKESQTRTGRVTAESRDLARQAYEQHKAALSQEANKYDMNSLLRNYRTYFKSTVGKATYEKARQITYNLLEKGDAPFVRNAFQDSIAQYCSAHGITDISQIPQSAVAKAQQDAYDATFKSASELATYINSAKKKGGAAGVALDVLFPFTTTPINIVSQMIQYSPAGFVRAGLQAYNKAGATSVIDSASRAAVGSVIIGLGYLGRMLGTLTGGEDDDDAKAAFDKATGNFPYSIFGKVSYDWAQPVGPMLAIGADIYESVKDDTNAVDAVLGALITSSDAVLNQSVFSNLVNTLQSGYSSPAEQVLKSTGQSFVFQMTPGILSDITDIVDPVVRSSYTGGNALENALASLKSNVPGLSSSLPASVNVKGEEVNRGNLALRAFNTLLNPSNVNTGTRTEADAELERIYGETGNKNVFMEQAPYKVTIDSIDHELVGVDRAKFQQTMGQAYYGKYVPEAMQSDFFRELPAEQQVEVLQSLQSQAKYDAIGIQRRCSGRFCYRPFNNAAAGV